MPDGSPAVDTRDLLIAAINQNPITSDEAWQVLHAYDALVADRDALQAKADEYDEMESALRLDHAALNDAEVTIESLREERKWIVAVNKALLEAHEAAVRDRDALQERADLLVLSKDKAATECMETAD